MGRAERSEVVKPYFYPGPKRICAAAKLAGIPDNGKTDESNPLFVAACIAYGECSGDVWQITHEADGSISYGAWQINSSHPEILRLGNWAIYTDNARMAVEVWRKRARGSRTGVPSAMAPTSDGSTSCL